MLYAIIEVNGNILIGEVMDFFFVFLDLQRLVLELLLLFGQLHPLGAGGAFQRIREVNELGAVTLLLLMDIIGAHPSKKITLIPVHINQRLEAILLAAVEEPIVKCYNKVVTEVANKIY